MRIAYYSDTYLPTMDGVVKSMIEFRRQLEIYDHEVFTFAPGSRETIQSNTDPKVFYYNSITFTPYPTYRLALNPWPSKEIIESKKIELIHSQTMGPMGYGARDIAKKKKLPFVGSFHTLIPYATHYISKRKDVQDFAKDVAWKYLKWYYGSCDVTIVPSNTIKELIEKEGFTNVKVVENGINLSPYEKSVRDRPSFNLNEEDFILLFVGRIVKEKNLEVLIRASKKIIKEMPNVKFIIAGKGPEENYYKDLVVKAEVTDYFKFLGFVPDSKIYSLYKSADVFIFPSKFETQGLSGIEAMASGLPVVGADYLAISEIIKNDYNGILFDPDDENDLIEKIMICISKKKKYSKNALETSKQFSIENTTNKLLEIYNDLYINKK
jgi:1,2-diacylglycerol 3-alpha-glucosyltransferase